MPSIGVAFVYFDYKNQENQTSEKVTRMLMKQLLSQIDQLPRDIKELYDRFSQCATGVQIEILLPLFTILASEFSTVYIVLDALDECSPNQLNCIITSVIPRLRQLNFKFICSSRPHFLNLADRLNTTSTLEIYAHETDIRNYLTERLDDEWPFDDTYKLICIDHIIHKAEGK
jgi:hypothetical protein